MKKSKVLSVVNRVVTAPCYTIGAIVGGTYGAIKGAVNGAKTAAKGLEETYYKPSEKIYEVLVDEQKTENNEESK